LRGSDHLTAVHELALVVEDLHQVEEAVFDFERVLAEES